MSISCELISKSKPNLKLLAARESGGSERSIYKDVYDVSKTDTALSEIDKLADGPKYLRNIILESPFYIFYTAARYLSESDNPAASPVILKMIDNSQDEFEQALGLLLLGARVQAKKQIGFDPIAVVKPFLSCKNERLRFYACMSLMRMQTPDAGKTLRECAELNPIINSLLPSQKKITDLPVFITGWVDAGNFQTAFFRNQCLLNELSGDFSQNPKSNFVVLDVGCATGLSTESIRIILNEKNNSGAKIKVIGTDINPFALWYAERGKYFLDYTTHSSLYDTQKRYHSEMYNLISYARRYKLNYLGVIWRYFTGEVGSISGQVVYSSQRNEDNISFSYDDITADYSQIPDASVDVIVYTNVHYEIPKDFKIAALQKIMRKLKSGGKVYVIDPQPETHAQFEKYFGEPIKRLGSSLRIYQKPK